MEGCAFAPGAPVQLNTDLDFGSDHLPIGALGRVVEVLPFPTGCAYWVRFQSLDRDVQVSESVLAAASAAAVREMAGGAFAPGAQVKLNRDLDLGPDHLPAGTVGRVAEVLRFPGGRAYWVRFQGLNRDVQVSESVLL
jgi:hypothetical protein